ncbi:hypothetical protein TCAL_15238 [Tigriopus californicus]|uniref:Uncharacterized protein n=1 Tax=Tigriopus californicus TaxID=6832 RepID=A0A553NBX2_TIGCA|nr:hypothetical protein TCAL_15238 [Tigriopus californicus]
MNHDQLGIGAAKVVTGSQDLSLTAGHSEEREFVKVLCEDIMCGSSPGYAVCCENFITEVPLNGQSKLIKYKMIGKM